MSRLRQLFGAVLIVGAYAPLHRLLAPERTGPAGRATVEAAEVAWTVGLSGSVIVLALAWVWVRALPAATAERPLNLIARALGAPPATTYSVGVGLVVFLLTAGIALGVHGAAPTSVDEMAQLLHAKVVASGRLALPVEPSPASWVLQNGVVTPEGWASIYPPLHTLLLALASFASAAWLVGPVATGVASASVTWSAEWLLGRPTGRATGALFVVSPFWLLVGATHLSHTTAAAALGLVLVAALKSTKGDVRWALALGGCIGAAVATRPWIGLVGSSAIVLTVWASQHTIRSNAPRVDRSRLRLARSAAAVAAGGLPFAALLFWWNTRLFGGPLEMGYTAAFGPSHGLGLHVDPWGNAYGFVEALAFSGADLSQLGVRLFESPLPAIAVVGFALLGRVWAAGAAVFAVWAVSALAANALYWHHGLHFGPRMLYESVPAWIALFAIVAVRALASERLPTELDGAELAAGTRVAEGGTATRFARWAVIFAVGSGVVLAPGAVLAPAGSALTTRVPSPPTEQAIVFVHGSWASRIAARMVGSGARRDSVETALRRNDVCAVDQYARLVSGSAAPATRPNIDFEPLPGSPAELQGRQLSPGNIVRVDPSHPHDTRCIREARADRLGSLELELLAWRYPPLPEPSVTLARDLGPAGNLQVIQAFARPAYVLADVGAPDGPVLLDYEEGMELLWGGAAGVGGGGP